MPLRSLVGGGSLLLVNERLAPCSHTHTKRTFLAAAELTDLVQRVVANISASLSLANIIKQVWGAGVGSVRQSHKGEGPQQG